MTPNDHWQSISPRHPSDSLRGWHFPKDEPKKSSLRGVFAVLAGALMVAVAAAFYYLS